MSSNTEDLKDGTIKAHYSLLNDGHWSRDMQQVPCTPVTGYLTKQSLQSSAETPVVCHCIPQTCHYGVKTSSPPCIANTLWAFPPPLQHPVEATGLYMSPSEFAVNKIPAPHRSYF